MYHTGEKPELGDTVAIIEAVANHPHHVAHIIGKVTDVREGNVSVTVWDPNAHTADVKAENLNLIRRS